MKKSFCLAFVLTSLVVLCLTGGCKVDVETPDYNLHTVTFECNGGSRISPQILVNGTTATEPKNPSKDGGQFLGWYADPQFNTSFDFGTPITQDVTVYAKWMYKVGFYDYYGEIWKTVDVAHGYKVERPNDNPVPNEWYRDFDNWFVDSERSTVFDFETPITESIAIYAGLYSKWEVAATKYRELPAGTDGTAGPSWTYVEFGDWPQTKKAENVSVDEDEPVYVGRFPYYKGSDGALYVKGMWYAKKDKESGVEYRDKNRDEYFKVEPIKWRVLTNNYNGKKLLLAENILMYYVNRSEYGGICEWLDDFFLETAFVKSEQDKIAETTVDNSVRSGNPDSGRGFSTFGTSEECFNTFSCDNTKNKIFLLSMQEVTKREYGFEEYNVFMGDSNGTATSSRIRMKTDFVDAGGDNWILRSGGDFEIVPGSRHAFSISVDKLGGIFDISHLDILFSDDVSFGIVPALCVEN